MEAQWTYVNWRKYNRHLPISECVKDSLAKLQLTFANGESPICENLIGEVPVTQLDSKCTFCLFRSHPHSLLTLIRLFRFIMFAFILHFQHTVKLKIPRPLVKTLPILPIVSLLHIRSSPIGLKILVAPL